jgi:4-amino-4-deoxy-L-arabinose transferase-like glycosyltransferase
LRKPPDPEHARTATPRVWVRTLDVLALIALSIAAFYLTFKAGMRGFYPFDQSIVFDGSYRVLQGQVPYKDFVMPFGPMVFWLHALFFRALGVTYFAYVFGAALVNVLAAWASVIILRLLFPPGRVLSYVAGAITAVWFYPPFGTPWVDQTAFFFSMLAIAFLLAAIFGARRRRQGDVLTAAAGVLAFLAFISKQNAGAFMLPGYFLLMGAVYLQDRKTALRRLIAFIAALGASAAGFALWLAVASDPRSFMHYAIRLASGLGRERLAAFVGNGFGILRPFFGGRGPLSARIAILASLVVAAVALVSACLHMRRHQEVPRRLLVASVLCVYGILFQHLFINTTLNQPENGLALMGIILAIAVGLVVGPREFSVLRILGLGRPARPRWFVPAAAAVTSVAVLALLVSGVRVSLNRVVMDVFDKPAFAAPFTENGLKGLRWGEPTQMGGHAIEGKAVSDLLQYLKERRANFFIFPDFTLMYGLAGVPSPQPLLWFHEGVTYPGGARDADLDARIVESLKRRNVRVVVIEQVAWFNTGTRLDAFPQMKAYVYGSFRRLGQIGTFSIYEMPPAGASNP